MDLNPLRYIRRRRRLVQEIEREIMHLRRLHGERAQQAALERLGRGGLTRWGRQVVAGAARRLGGQAGTVGA